MNKVSFYGSAAIVMAAVFTVSTYAQEWEMPRTEFGDPDLQGIWSNATQTRLERDAALGEQQAFTDEEALARESRSRDRQIEADRASDPDRSPPTDGNTAAGYNSFWLDRGNSVVRINGEYRTSMIIDPPNGKIPLLPVAERSATQLQRWLQQPLVEPFDGPELQTIGERCLLFWDFRTSNSSAGPPMMPVIYNNNYQIVQTKDYVVILAEMIHDARIIRLRDEHHSTVMNQWMGDSVGYWEDDTLVVETRNLHPQQNHYGSSPDLVVIERFTRSSAEQIDYQFTMVDPAVYSQPWTAELAFRQRPEVDVLYEFACHEGNYALGGILAGARRAESDANPP
ncbi:hypothetical protein N9F77_01950 [Gammaproteobacteria bacterium]|nr:hypothetical protein [Gammaproteobacteria bacterium]